MAGLRERLRGLTGSNSESQRSARQRVRETARKAKQDVRTLDRKTFTARQKAAAAAQRASQAIEGADIDIDAPDQRSIADRARAAGEARAPVDATFNMTGNPRAIESMAMAGGGQGSEGADETSSLESFVTGSASGSGTSMVFGGDGGGGGDGGENDMGFFTVDVDDGAGQTTGFFETGSDVEDGDALQFSEDFVSPGGDG